MDTQEQSLLMHEKNKGKLAVKSKVRVETREDLSIAYTPGVAEPCRKIAANVDDVYKYTPKGNMVAVVSDGSAVLGLGNIGARASFPVMEGKAILFKSFADIDAFPICLETQDTDKTIETVKNIAPGFGGINLEDIKAPECFVIESALQDLGIPVMHDDQHGTAVVVLAALTNALKVVGKTAENVKIVINGAGAAGVAIAKLLLVSSYKGENIILCDSKGPIYDGREDLADREHKRALAKQTNPNKIEGTLADAIKDADVFLGVSVKDAVTPEMVKSMNKDPIVIAMANPDPEIMPDAAKEAGAVVVATGRSDFPNQVNNVLGFPGIFRGALDSGATRITEEMKVAAFKALAELVAEPTADEILPSPVDKSVVPAIAKAVGEAWANQKGEETT